MLQICVCEFYVHVYVLVYELRTEFGSYVYYLLGNKQIFKMWTSGIYCCVFHSSNPTISIVQAMYKMHVSIAYICKC
jgi:hypothetical protein